MSTEYHKIQSIYKRDPETKFKTFLEGEYSLPEFEYLRHLPWDWYEKVDGTNIRVIWDGENVRFGGRTERAQIQTSLLNYLQDTFTPEKFQEVTSGDLFVLYGEGYGAGIQKGGGDYVEDDSLKTPFSWRAAKQGFILFDVAYYKNMWAKMVGDPEYNEVFEEPIYEVIWLNREKHYEIGEQFNIPIVPIIGQGPLNHAVLFCKEGFPSVLRKSPPEGLVCKPQVELKTRMGQRIITKVKLCDFPKTNS